MLELLFSQKFEKYVSSLKDDSALWIFVHVPKTAGSSLRAEMAQVLLPEANIFVDYNDPTKTFMHNLDAAVARFVARNAEAPFRFVSGHIFPRHVDQIERQAAVPVRRVTMLRQPVRRVVSDYRYQCSPMHPGNEAFRRSFPTFESYLEQPGEQNKATRYLVPEQIMATQDPGACVDHIIQRYHFVGLQEMYPLAFRLLFSLLGERRSPTMQIRVNEGGDSLANDPAVIARVEARNALDVAVYKALLDRWRTIREPLLAYLNDA